MSLLALRNYKISGVLLRSLPDGCSARPGTRWRYLSQWAYMHQPSSEPLLYRSLGEQYAKTAQKYGQKAALISCYEQKTLSFEQAQYEAQKLLQQLRAMNLKMGDVVGIWAPNSTQWYISFLACCMGGYAVACLNPALQPAELLYALRKGQVQALITMDQCGRQNFVQVLQKALQSNSNAAELPLKHIIVKSSQALAATYKNFDELLSNELTTNSIEKLRAETHCVPPESVCCIQFTSGTTGQPKAALLSHFSFINNCRVAGRQFKLADEQVITCLTMPMFHVFGLSVVAASMFYGTTLVLPSAFFNAAEVLKAIEEQKCVTLTGSPTMFVDVVAQQQQLQKDLSSLHYGLTGGASCTQEIYKRIKQQLGLEFMFIGYGLSESNSAVFGQDGSEEDEWLLTQTVGKLFEHMEAKVINAKGETVKFGQAGELCIRGPYRMLGYFGDAEKTKEAITPEGWFKTGDEFILESNGYGRVVGRKKDLIIRGGENIYPKEIEDHLDAHEHILESQIVGVPDERMGEEVCAFLRLQPNAPQLNEEDIKAYCTGVLSHFKIPRYVRILDEFPKTNSGKIQKFKLVEIFKQLKA